MQAGDQIFFDNYKQDGNIGIYPGEGKFIGAQSPNGVSIEDMTQSYWKERFIHRFIHRIN
jgi:peptidoglycan DL-endopeptidase CwlO